MNEWETRGHAFEKQHAHDMDQLFKIRARRNKLLGHWAAGKLGLDEAQVEAYAKKLVEDHVAEADDAVLAKWLAQELAVLNEPISDHRIERRIQELTAVATKEILEGK